MYRSIRGIIAAIALCLAAAPLAAKPKIDLTEHPLAEHMRVEIRMPQQEVFAESTQTNPMMFGGGLLGALISAGVDNSAAKKAEGEIGPFRDKLVDTDWREVAREAIEQGLSREAFAPELEFSFHETMPLEDRKAKTLATGDRVLVIVPSYMFAGHFSMFKAHLDISIVNRTPGNGRVLERVLYVDSFDYGFVLPDWNPKDKRQKRIAAWKQVDGARLTAMLREAFTGVVALFNEDLVAGHPDAPRRAEKVRYAGLQGFAKGKLVATEGTRKTYRVSPVLKGTVDVAP